MIPMVAEDSGALAWFGVLGGVAAVLTVAWTAYRDIKGGGLRKGQAEAAKADAEAAKGAMDAEATKASLPHLQEQIRMGNWSAAFALQQQYINGLEESLGKSEERNRAKDKRIDELEERISQRDARIDELEERLGAAETHLDEARSIISELRNAPDHTTPEGRHA